ncbi:hypothetical protein [Gudongella sp. DL1XJH-153]|uniref:hypothetical protein n=1 Tax=Gudongella sp. DL1XJH-153 TaxID=3409804 RepID=UPI003BB67196
MKNRLIIFSAILLISIMVVGGTFAWFTSSPEASLTKGEMGIIKVEVIENGLDNISVKNIGLSDCYVRVRLIPKWSNQTLSVSNVDIDINGSYWIEKDGYCYYKGSLGVSEMTTDLIESIVVGELTPEYEGAILTLKVVAEGVQTTNEAWKEVWSIDSLPF